MRYILLALILGGCGDTQTWDVWVNHGQLDSCHGSLTADVDDGAFAGPWACGGTTYEVVAKVRDYDGALIGRTSDGRPVVGYVK